MDIVKMVDELLELEEKLDHFFLTSYERRKFQNEVMDRIISADRKTEPSDLKNLHSCMTCKHKDKADNDFPCVRCFYDDTMYEPQTDYSNYERAIEQIQYDMLYESTYNAEDGSM